MQLKYIFYKTDNKSFYLHIKLELYGKTLKKSINYLKPKQIKPEVFTKICTYV